MFKFLQKDKINLNKTLFITIILFVIIALATVSVAYTINDIAAKDCVDILNQAASETKNDIQQRINLDQKQLEKMASTIATYEQINNPDTYELLKLFDNHDFISRLEILLPNNQILQKDGNIIDGSNIISFDELARKGMHISNINNDLLDNNEKVLHSYVPIVKNKETIGILYSVINLKVLPTIWKTQAYHGQARVLVVDGNTGEFISNNWENPLSNLEELRVLKIADDYSFESFVEAISKGKEGKVIFTTKTKKESIYFYYLPLDINNWTICISVPESVAFKNVHSLRTAVYYFMAFETICFLSYLFWMLDDLHKKAQEKQKRLDEVNYIYNVEKVLFSAHQDIEQISEALKVVAKATSAKIAFFVMFNETENDNIFNWCDEIDKNMELCKILKRNKFFVNEISIETATLKLDNLEYWRFEKPVIYQELRRTGANNFAEVPVKDEHENIIGMLGVINMESTYKVIDFLEQVKFSFSMFYKNLTLFNMIKEMGEKDYLTGLLNRNSYQERIETYKKVYKTSLACIYFDANGLHELNNTSGHDAGDKMLQNVGKLICTQFGKQNAYRIGGDEFLAFAVDQDEASIQVKINEIKTTLENQGYYLSVGLAWQQKVTSLKELVKESEQKMYQDKNEFYQKNGIEPRNR